MALTWLRVASFLFLFFLHLTVFSLSRGGENGCEGKGAANVTRLLPLSKSDAGRCGGGLAFRFIVKIKSAAALPHSSRFNFLLLRLYFVCSLTDLAVVAGMSVAYFPPFPHLHTQACVPDYLFMRSAHSSCLARRNVSPCKWSFASVLRLLVFFLFLSIASSL